MPVEFGPAAADLSQGDLIELVPSVYVRDFGYMVRLDADRYRLQAAKPDSFDVDREHAATATAVRRMGLVLTHDCEIDKAAARASALIALVRALTGVPEEHRAGFREYTRHRAFYLPESRYLPGEHYADLRAVTTVRRAALDSLQRRASMTEDGRRMLREQLFRFFTRRYLPSGWTEWPEDQE